MRSDMDKAAEDFYSCLTKSLALRSDAEPALQLETDRECMRRRGRFDLLRLEYLARLSDISARKHQHVISFFGSVVATVVEALESGLEALGDVSPVVGDVSRAADEQQSELERQQMMRLQVILGECREKTEPLSNHSIELADTFPHSSLPRTSKSTRPCCPRRCPRRGQEAAAMARACATK